MTHAPTAEQAAIISHVHTSRTNLIVDALAGAAKTSTLVMAMQGIPGTALSLAFNKRIAEELATSMPPNVECRTLNSIGHRMWGAFLGKRLKLDKNKRADLLRAAINAQAEAAQAELWKGYRDMLQALEHSARSGHVPAQFKHARGLMTDEQFFDALNFEPTDLEWRIMRSCITEAIALGMAGIIDFTDQIFLPAVFPASFDPFPLTLIDEAQDLSFLDHRLLKKIVGHRGRLIAVGDPAQSIYGFRGAAENSMEELSRTFNMDTLPLTMSFRCSRAVVSHVLWRAPTMRYPEWAKPGSVTTLDDWTPASVPDGAAIICRNNAPLLRTAIAFIKADRRPELVGNDVVAAVVKDLKKLGPASLDREASLTALAKWKADMLARYRGAQFVIDKAACLQVLIEAADNLSGAMAWAESLAKRKGEVKLLTGHKAKGLEFERVFFLDEFLVKSDDEQQEANLRYVICTRAKDALTYINSPKGDEE
jgi:DNA helicase-2/ATP-dependent DNA helicase PcrA